MMRALIVACAMALCGAPAEAGRFSFGAYGDTPYFDFEIPKLMRMIDEMNQRPLLFSVHVGDIKSGSDRCDPAVYEQRAAWFGQSRHPVLVLPGDNDWTDCARPSNGGYDPLDRLALFRSTFHAGDFGARATPLGVVRQSAQPPYRDFVENLRFVREGVMFTALHVVGSKNNIEQTTEFLRRQQANLSWLRESFAEARAQKAQAAVVMLHANPMLEMAASDPRRKGYADLTDALFEEVENLGRPVLLIHGDTHHFRFEQPLRARSVPAGLRQLTRLEVHGSPSVAWTEVVVDTSRPEVFGIAARP